MSGYRLTATEREEVAASYLKGARVITLAMRYAKTQRTIYSVLKAFGICLRHKEATRARKAFKIKPAPSLEEIEERCLEVQAGWDAGTRREREVTKVEFVTVTHIGGGDRRRNFEVRLN